MKKKLLLSAFFIFTSTQTVLRAKTIPEIINSLYSAGKNTLADAYLELDSLYSKSALALQQTPPDGIKAAREKAIVQTTLIMAESRDADVKTLLDDIQNKQKTSDFERISSQQQRTALTSSEVSSRPVTVKTPEREALDALNGETVNGVSFDDLARRARRSLRILTQADPADSESIQAAHQQVLSSLSDLKTAQGQLDPSLAQHAATLEKHISDQLNDPELQAKITHAHQPEALASISTEKKEHMRCEENTAPLAHEEHDTDAQPSPRMYPPMFRNQRFFQEDADRPYPVRMSRPGRTRRGRAWWSKNKNTMQQSCAAPDQWATAGRLRFNDNAENDTQEDVAEDQQPSSQQTPAMVHEQQIPEEAEKQQ